jgi:hypothetical protein
VEERQNQFIRRVNEYIEWVKSGNFPYFSFTSFSFSTAFTSFSFSFSSFSFTSFSASFSFKKEVMDNLVIDAELLNKAIREYV